MVSACLLYSRKNAITSTVHEIGKGYETINFTNFCSSDSFNDVLCYIGADFTPLRDQDEAAIPNGSPVPSTEANQRKKLHEHFRESILWEGRVSDDEDNSRVKPRTHVLVYPNKSHFGSTKRPTSAHWILKEKGSKSGRPSHLIRRCLERFALCRPSRGKGKEVCSSIVET